MRLRGTVHIELKFARLQERNGIVSWQRMPKPTTYYYFPPKRNLNLTFSLFAKSHDGFLFLRVSDVISQLRLFAIAKLKTTQPNRHSVV